MAAVRSIEEAGAAIDDITLRAPTLNEVFLALTGRGVDDPEGTRQDAA